MADHLVPAIFSTLGGHDSTAERTPKFRRLRVRRTKSVTAPPQNQPKGSGVVGYYNHGDRQVSPEGETDSHWGKLRVAETSGKPRANVRRARASYFQMNVSCTHTFPSVREDIRADSAAGNNPP